MENSVKEEFTFEKSFEYQRQELSRWEKLLKPQYYNQLLSQVEEKNAKGYKTPFDVCRGSSISNIVHNLK